MAPPARTVRLPLHGFSRWVPDAPDMLSGDAVQAVVRLRAALVDVVRREAAADRASALQWLSTLLDRARELSEPARQTESRMLSHPYRVAQIMYAVLLEQGPLDFGLPPPSRPNPFFEQDAYTALGEAVAVSNALVQARRGLSQLGLEGTVLVMERTQEDLPLVEFGQNVEHAPPDGESLNVATSGAVSEVSRAVTGSSLDDLMAFVDPHRPDSGLAGRQDGDLCYVDLARTRPDAARTVEAFTLTADRLRRFEAPYFLDLGVESATPHANLDASLAGEMMWLAYYPFLDALAARRPATRMAITTYPLLAQVITTADLTQAHLLHRLERSAARRDEATRDAAARMVRDVHRRFEESAGERFRAAGMRALTGVSHSGGRELPCGEIDLLALGTHSSGQPVVVVGEAKNVDLALFKDLGHDHLRATMQRAAAQVERKSEWVARSWPAAAALLGLDPAVRPVVAGLIVTRRPVPLHMAPRWPVIVPGEIDSVVRHMIMRPVSEWRGDLSRGVVQWTG